MIDAETKFLYVSWNIYLEKQSQFKQEVWYLIISSQLMKKQLP